MLSFSEGEYHLFEDDGTVALTDIWYRMEALRFYSIVLTDFPQYSGFFICSVTSGPSLHAHLAGFSTMDQSQLAHPKEVVFVKE